MNKRRLEMKGVAPVAIAVVIIVAIVVAVGAYLVLKPPEEPEEMTITFWHHETPSHRVVAFQKVIDMFEEDYPNVTIEQEVVGWGDTWPKTITAIQEGTTPDFEFSLPDLTLTAYEYEGILTVNDLVSELDAEYNFFDSTLATCKIGADYYGVPIWTMPMVLIYRPSIFEKYLGTTDPPETWDELLEYAEKLHNPDDEVYGIGLGGALDLMTQEQVYVFMAATGAMTFDAGGNLVFDNPQTVEAYQMYKDLFEYTPPGASEWSWGEIEMNFAAGKVAMMPYFGGLQKRFLDMDSTDLAGAPMPLAPGRTTWKTISYPNPVMIFKSAEEEGHLEMVNEFIKHMMKPEVNAILTAEQEPGSFIPCTEDAAEASAYWADTTINTFKAMNEVIVEAVAHGTLYGFEHGKVVNEGIGAIVGASIYAEVVQMMITGGMTVEEAVSYGEDRMEEVMGG